jgi:hypothetical protein
MTLWIREPGRAAVPTPAWPGGQYVYSEAESFRYETPSRDEEVVDSRLLVSPDLGFHRRLTGFISIPSSTPISMTIIASGEPVDLHLKAWGGAISPTITTFEYWESPFSNWAILDASRFGRSRLPATLAWARFLAQLSLLTVDETPTSDAAVDPSRLPAAAPDSSASDDVTTAMDAVQAILGLTTEEVSVATGVGLRTLRRWRSHTVQPRRHTARAVWRLYVAARALQRGLGSQGVAAWLHVGSPSPMGLLAEGDLARFERLARSRILTAERPPQPFTGFAEEPPLVDEGEPRQYQRATRRPARGRLSSR